MKKTDKKILEEIIRVDHAGERGASKIYEGQLLALKTIKNDDNLKFKTIDDFNTSINNLYQSSSTKLAILYLSWFQKWLSKVSQKSGMDTASVRSIFMMNKTEDEFWVLDSIYILDQGRNEYHF